MIASKKCTDTQVKINKRKRSYETEIEIDKQYLKHLKVISEKADDDKDPDLLFLRSLILLWRTDNLEFKAEMINLLKTKLERTYFVSNLSSAATSTYSNYSRPYSATSVHSVEEETTNTVSPVLTIFIYCMTCKKINIWMTGNKILKHNYCYLYENCVLPDKTANLSSGEIVDL